MYHIQVKMDLRMFPAPNHPFPVSAHLSDGAEKSYSYESPDITLLQNTHKNEEGQDRMFMQNDE